MKTFVSLITVLVIATAAVWLLNQGAPSRAQRAKTEAMEQATQAIKGAESIAASRDGGGMQGTKSPGTGAPSASSEPAGGIEGQPSPSGLAQGLADALKPPADGASTAPSGHNAYHTAASALPTTKPILPPSSTGTTPTNAAPPSSAEHSTPATAEKPANAAGSDTGPKFTLGPETEVKKEDDGWTRLDGRFLVRGSGSKTDPLIVPWELLVSASETYRPRTGLKEMPRRVADLKGKHVKVTGYALFPLMSLETTELLLMRNQWDGCCIGVPPTPYDAVEITLSKPADRKDTFVTFVTLEGVLDVDPYVNRDFLLGLYTLKDATISQPAKGKDAEKGL
ncbi:MAG: DUF3299 domain-containing protein [Phycisphaerales bacterium]